MKVSFSWLSSFVIIKSTDSETIHSPKLKGLLYKRVDKDKMNGIGRLYIQLRYPWLDSFVGTISREQSMNSPN